MTVHDHLMLKPLELPPIQQPPLTPEETAKVEEWCARNIAHWDPEARAAFRRALLDPAKEQLRRSVRL